MTVIQPPPRVLPKGGMAATLARDHLGVRHVMFFVLAEVAPLTVVAGIITTAFAVTGLVQVPAAFVVVAAVLMLFSVGYVAMARRISNAGAFYTYAVRGLGRPAGVATAFVAVLSYVLLQLGLLGAFGAGMTAYAADHWSLELSWWVWALAAWAVAAILAVRRIDLSGVVLGVLCLIEIGVIVVLDLAGLGAAVDHSLSTLNPLQLPSAGLGALLAIAVLGFVGFESAVVFSEEARHPRRTVPVATYASLGVIALVYAASSWVLTAHYGTAAVVEVAREQGPGMVFGLGGGRALGLVAESLYLTSIFAALLAFHNAVARYLFALGRENVLPTKLGTANRVGAPSVASVTQSLIGLATIGLYAILGWDPLVEMFFYLGTWGGVGVLILITITSAAVFGYFLTPAHRDGDNAWRTLLAPAISAVLLVVMAYLAVRNFDVLMGVPPDDWRVWAFPTAYGAAAGLGLLWAAWLRLRRPDTYFDKVGLGPNAARVGSW